MVELAFGALHSEEILQKWYERIKEKNCGALTYFVGIVRDEEGIEGLSFEIYESLLQKWFLAWEERLQKLDSHIFMAHSIGDVTIHKSSFVACIASPKRRVALEYLDAFVEDFKTNAPIWKYDIKNGKKIYAESRSHKIEGYGILGKESL